ncbi:hypothetical protein [Brevibacillus fortis]|uniref:Uncharacterized protein n=1 Tax=Brevibacillus fortis TaxID=2126352 RepID=A0A2P7URH7_9BACL|nr:hypothetical protein [Brevibacillus fortis]PSJ89443.1 hypothetical protein C7R93_23420 [Brevibacillus fortis]
MRSEMIQIIIQQTKEKVSAKTLEDHEAVVGIMAMAKNYTLNEESVRTIIHEVFDGDKERMAKALTVASHFIDESMIQKIISDVQ